MANTVRIKRSTSTNTPTTLANAELAYSEASNKLFIGVGTGGVGGSATSIVAIGGTGAFLDLTTAASTYAPLASPTFTGTVTIPSGASISGFAPLASPTFTGTPLSTTASVSTNTTQIATTAFVLGQGNSTAGTIGMNGVQAAGTSNLYARADHIHPTDTTLAPLASPTFTGTVTIPSGASISGFAPLASPTFTGAPISTTAAAGTNTTQIATTAFVVGQASSTNPEANGTAATGTSLKYARADHVHVSDTTRAALAGATFTGKVNTVASATGTAGLNVPHGAAPTSPTNGDIWTTTSGVYAQVNTATAQLATVASLTSYAPLASPTFTGTVTIPAGASISGFAPLASPTLTGTPAAPTATAGTNTTQVATTAFVSTAVSNLIGGASAALDTLNELATALGNDASFAATISTSLGEKLVKSSNLSDLTSNSTARTNLGLGTMATQAASSVSITGGTIDGVTIDGGSF